LNLLLDVLNLILGLFQVDDLDGHHLLRPVVQALVDLAERALADPLLLREHQFGVDPLQKKEENIRYSVKQNFQLFLGLRHPYGTKQKSPLP